MTRAKPRVKTPFAPRPYETDYAGTWPGHAKTLEGAVTAAHKRLVNGEYRKATVTGPSGVEARLHWTPVGVITWAPKTTQNRTKMRFKGKK